MLLFNFHRTVFLKMRFFLESSNEAIEEGIWPLQSGSKSEDQWDELCDYGESMNVNETKMTVIKKFTKKTMKK